MIETLVLLVCGICDESFPEFVPMATLTDDNERSRCAALQLPICSKCEAQAEVMRDQLRIP
jgi:hypothetical protein